MCIHVKDNRGHPSILGIIVNGGDCPYNYYNKISTLDLIPLNLIYSNQEVSNIKVSLFLYLKLGGIHGYL